MSKELDKIIEKIYGPTQPEHDCFGNFEDKKHAKRIATEYAESDEVKRRHWNELLNAMVVHANWLSLGPAYWETYKFDNDCDSDDLRGIVETKDFACETKGDWVALFRHCKLATKSNSKHWSDD